MRVGVRKGYKRITLIWFLEKSREGGTYMLLAHPPGQVCVISGRGELSYLAPLGSENISFPYFKQCFFGGGITPPD